MTPDIPASDETLTNLRPVEDVIADLRVWTSNDPEFGPLLTEAANRLRSVAAGRTAAFNEAVQHAGKVRELRAEVSRLSGELETARAAVARASAYILERHNTREARELVASLAAPAVVSGTSQAAAEPCTDATHTHCTDVQCDCGCHEDERFDPFQCRWVAAVAGTVEQAAPTWRGMPISACGLKPSHAHHVYDDDGTKTVCMGSLFTLDGAPDAFLKDAADAAPAPTPAEDEPADGAA